ncbi:MAG: penicillin acylase family protein [Ignavibacteriaceae bacterium]|nr:penicillin acylase family protein [Ignavibacteriaceae bacterium]
MKKILTTAIVIVASLLIILVVSAFFIFRMFKSTTAQTEGTLYSAGVSAPVEIYRDSLAVPYIISANENDAAFAMGFLHAQERLFQMDVSRRAAEGRLSEILGTETIPFDRMFRTVGIHRMVRDNYSRVDSKTIEILEAYARGVNYFINNNRSRLPIEFDLLGYEPYPWKPEHSLFIVRMMAWELNIAWWEDIAFTHLVQTLGTERASLLLPDYPENAPVIVPGSLAALPPGSLELISTDRAFRAYFGKGGTHIGSNNWVVNANMSASGRPIIANDPHLQFMAPGRWYAAVVKGGALDVAGVSLPGVPMIVIGKNASVSWALTNVMADDADFYTEKVNLKNRTYLLDGAEKPLRKVKELIKVKDSMDVELDVYLTHRGPIVNEIHPYTLVLDDPYKYKPALSMRWTGLEFSEEFRAFYGINKSKNWDDFRNAVSLFAVPGQNFVYADAAGNIGYICGAKLALRGAGNPMFAMDGSSSANDWKGYLPAAQMPSLYNPLQNYIASANNKTVKSFPHYISNLWEPSSRITRIKTLLESKPRHSVEDYKAYQIDITSPYAAKMTRYLLRSFEKVKVNDRHLQEALSLLKTWDYSFDAFSQVPAIYSAFFRQLLKKTFADEMDASLLNEYFHVANVPYRVMERIIADSTNILFDDRSTEKYETREMILRESLSDALTELEKKHGKDMSKWQWGRIHKVELKHLFSSPGSIVNTVLNIGPYGTGGDGTTVMNGEYSFREYSGPVKSMQTEDFKNILGPSMRLIYDFANPDEFHFVMPGGQSGNPFSTHYKDMTINWVKGGYFKIKTDINSIKQNKALLILSPEAGGSE